MRADVVVPMQIFSYLPSPTLRTFGAVWSRNAPPRSIGGSTCSSKIRICVRTRMPMLWPCTVTSSPARSLRISCGSVIGNVTSCDSMWLRLPVEVDRSVGGDVRRRAAGGPALVVHRDRIERHVRVGVLDVAIQHGDVAAEPHRADAGLVQEAHQLVLQLCDEGIRIARADRAGDCLLREVHRVVGGAADPDPDDARR